MTIDGYCALGIDREYDLTADALIAGMDQAGVDRAVIAPVDRCLAVRNREGNDFILSAARSHPRLVPACSVNPWFGEEAPAELERSVEAGSRMLVLHPFVQGYQCNDELTWPVVEMAVRLRVPIYIHTGHPGNSTPWQVIDLAVRYPEGKFIMGHCGATDFWNDVVGAACAVENVYLEASCARPFNFLRYMNEAGQARGIMGSFAPHSDVAFEWEQMRKVLPQSQWPGLYGSNLSGLLSARGAL